jgi:drug/metabolite transporter (DMT)-like permease
VARLHVAVAGLFNVIGFGLFSSFAMLAATTSRVVIVNYSMPVWASLLAWPLLGERLNLRVGIALVLCASGLATLVYPVAAAQSAGGLMLALGCALSWAAGTIYMKWAKIPGDLLTITAWQIALGAVVFTMAWPIFQGVPVPAPVSQQAVLAILYNGLIGTGFAYILWFAIIARLPTATASLGSLATPVIGVVGSMLLLGERPTTEDMIGFALIFAAAACVLVQPRASTAAQAP